MDQLDYATRMEQCKKTIAQNPMIKAALESKEDQLSRDFYLNQTCDKRIKTEQQKEKLSRVNKEETLSKVDTIKDEKISKLPIVKNLDLIKKQKEAEFHTKKTELERKKQELEEIGVDDVKAKLKGFATQTVKSSLLPKLPTVDPKFLAAISFAKKLKEVRDKKQQVSKENLKKSTEMYTFPIKKVSPVTEPPTPLPPPVPPDIPTKPPSTTPKPEPTKPIKSKFTYVLDGGGGLPFELTAVRYDGQLLNITSWPINRKFSPTYGYNNYEDGLKSVRAYIQDQINRGVFDSFVRKPY